MRESGTKTDIFDCLQKAVEFNRVWTWNSNAINEATSFNGIGTNTNRTKSSLQHNANLLKNDLVFQN